MFQASVRNYRNLESITVKAPTHVSYNLLHAEYYGSGKWWAGGGDSSSARENSKIHYIDAK